MKYIIVIIACTLSFKTNAQRGALDKTFGTEGIVISKTFNAGCEATAIQADGKIIAAGAGGYNGVGGFFLARYNTDGTLDSNFGDKGRVITDFIETGSSRIESVAALPNGKILAAGFFAPSSLVDIVLLQYNANGNLDSSFGENGIVITDIAKYDYIYDMAIQPDGKIIVAGDRRKSDNDNKTSFTVRYMPDGNLDESFGDNGIALTSYNASIDITTVALQTDGKIVLGGIYHSGEDEFMLVRYQSNGVLDSTFDGNGIATLRFKDGLSEYAELFDIAVQPDGKILATGDNNDGNKIVVARFKSNGEADEEFGTVDGYTSPFFENGTSYGSTVLIQQDGKILIAGTHYNQVEGFYTLIRLKNDGTRDSTFGDNGITLTSFNNIGYITCGAAAIQPDGKVVLVGTLEQDIAPYYYFLLTRYNNDGGIVPPPEFAKIQKWQGHYGFTWNSWPGNKTTYYSVGRSTNASTFTEIAQVTDIPKQKKYKFEDPNPLIGIVYYRLTAVRTDGVMVNSNIITCGNDAGFIQLYPNPAKNSLRVEGLSATEKTKLSILDFSGYTKLVTTVTGSSCNFNIAQLKPGNYMLVIETKGNVVTKKFVKEQ